MRGGKGRAPKLLLNQGPSEPCYATDISHAVLEMNGSVREPNKFHDYETEKITRKASDAAEYIELFGSSTRDRHAGCI